MRKVESTRALCDYYNEIVYKVNKLTEMCGNTPEAIKLKDDIDDIFTVKFSEPLDDVAELQEQIGCPLEVLNKIKKEKQIYVDTYVVQKPSGCNMTIRKGMYKVIGIDILNNKIQCLIQFFDSYEVFYISTYEYKAGWFLKENRSE
jgi:hypothetical protein